VRELIRAIRELGDRPIAAATRFDDLGLDSLDRLELLVRIEDHFGIALLDEHLSSPTVGHVVDVLCAWRRVVVKAG